MIKVLIGVLIVVGCIFLMPLLTKYVYGLIIPAIFPGVVGAGYLAPNISYWVAFWLGVGPIGAFGIKSQSSD